MAEQNSYKSSEIKSKEEYIADLMNYLTSEEAEALFNEIEEYRISLNSDEKKKKIAEFFNIMGNKNDRFDIFLHLGKEKRTNLDLQTLLDKKQPAISHQLKLMNDSNIIMGEKSGKFVNYSLNYETFHNFKALLKEWINSTTNWFGE